MKDRLFALGEARPELSGFLEYFSIWNLRGHAADITRLRPDLQKAIEEDEFGLIIVDPAYKLFGDGMITATRTLRPS